MNVKSDQERLNYYRSYIEKLELDIANAEKYLSDTENVERTAHIKMLRRKARDLISLNQSRIVTSKRYIAKILYKLETMIDKHKNVKLKEISYEKFITLFQADYLRISILLNKENITTSEYEKYYSIFERKAMCSYYKTEYFTICKKCGFKTGNRTFTIEEMEEIDNKILELRRKNLKYSDIARNLNANVSLVIRRLKRMSAANKDIQDELENIKYYIKIHAITIENIQRCTVDFETWIKYNK